MEELTQAQQFVVWYERICRDRDYAARYFDLANRAIRKSMEQRMIKLTDTEMLDWINKQVAVEIRNCTYPGTLNPAVRVTVEPGTTDFEESFDYYADTMRDAISRAMESEK